MEAEIGRRTYGEAMRIYGSVAKAADRLDCGLGTVYGWCHGRHAPRISVLARLELDGADTGYILTGRRR